MLIEKNIVPIYEIERNSKIVYMTKYGPQITSVHEDRFIIPLYPIEFNTSLRDFTDNIKERMLLHVAPYICTCDYALIVESLKQNNLIKNNKPFDTIVSFYSAKTLKFLLAQAEFLGRFVIHERDNSFGAFMFLDSIIGLV